MGTRIFSAGDMAGYCCKWCFSLQGASSSSKTLTRVAVDLTGLEPGGANGGARLVALSLVQEMSVQAPAIEFTLLTASASHAELAALDRDNVRRECVLKQPGPAGQAVVSVTSARHALRDSLRMLVGPRQLARLRSAYWALRFRTLGESTLRRLGSQLYFCPLTSGLCSDPAVPRVSIIHDLQHARFPQFFTVEQRYFRDQQFQAACEQSTLVVCVSDHVRDSVLATYRVDPLRVVTEHHAILQPIGAVSDSTAAGSVSRFGLDVGGFLLYPSNFWPHKNHERLLDALAMFRARHPGSNLRLVCTGVLDVRGHQVRTYAAQSGLAECVVFTGYVARHELAALLSTCRALIYPSLFEGFGMPVLEAMACGKPVLCSRAASLPEIAGDAAMYFDADQTASMCTAIEWLDSDTTAEKEMVARGRARVAAWLTPAQMAERYLARFQQAFAAASP